MHDNSLLAVTPGIHVLAPYLEHQGRSTEHIHHECRCEICARGGRATVKANTNRRSRLEETIHESFLIHPYGKGCKRHLFDM